MERSRTAEGRVYCFGECRFIPDRQLLLHRDVPVRIGSRALDLLHALVQQAGSLVSKDDLIRFAWPNTFVDESNLKVNMAYLRRALSQSRSDLPYIATVTGRGYRFVAPLHTVGGTDAPALPDAVRAITGDLPPQPPPIGREDILVELAALVEKNRLLTIVGPAGVGKTCIATAAARQLGERFHDGVCFVDLATIADPQLVAPAIGFAVGLDDHLANVMAGLVDLLRDQELLLILDNCEHVLNAVASVADHLHHALPGLSIIATSREPLRCRMEAICRLAPLDCPAKGSEAEASAAMRFPAVELLVRRAEAHGYRLVQRDFAALSAITRRLDGIALALELAAPRLAAIGAPALADLLEQSFETLAARHDAAPPRHRTLIATLDWSYRLLSTDEARLLRHLSIFGGDFALEDVVGTVPHLGRSAEDLATWLESLVAKSLLVMSYRRGRQRYRMLDSTRSFAAERLRSEGEALSAMTGYAQYLLSLFEQAEAEWNWRTREDWTASYRHWGNDLRRAIEWAFGDGGDVELGIRLTGAGITFWNEFSSVGECRTRVATALEAAKRLPHCDPQLKLKLVAAHATNGCFSSKLDEEVEADLRHSQRLAEQSGSIEYRLRSTLGLVGVQAFTGQHREALSTVAELRRIIDAAGENTVVPDADRLEFVARFYRGEIEHGQAGLAGLARDHASVAHRCRTSRFQLDRFVAIRSYLAVPTWVTGDHAGALKVASDAIEAAAALDHAVSYSHAMAMAAIPVSLWCGLLDLAQEQVTKLFDAIDRRQIDFWEPVARFYQSAIDAALGKGDALERMRAAIDDLAASNQRPNFPARLAMLADTALRRGRCDIARTSISEALDYADERDERWCGPELLRILGLVRWHDGDALGAGQALEEAVQTARKSGALSFELRAATSRAELALKAGRGDDALAQLAAVCARIDRGFDSADVVTARALLESHDTVLCAR